MEEQPQPRQFPEQVLNPMEVEKNVISTVSNEEELTSRWELDTKPYLERVYHDLLGESESDGIWIKDKHKVRIMNELGASSFIKEISSRVSVHMQFSELEQEDIVEIASMSAEVYADKLEDNWQKWDINPMESNLFSIAQMLFDILYISLRIANGGAMKKHREKSRNPYNSYIEEMKKSRQEVI